MNHESIQKKLLQKQHLNSLEAEFLAEQILDLRLSEIQIAAALTALSIKGETAIEIASFIKEMRKRMILLPGHEDAIDTCGTGGDGANTFNISTAVALIVAGAGIKVAKHGNRKASSLCGSSDCLEALGVNIGLISRQSVQVLTLVNAVFLFAPLYHPALKPLGPIRQQLGFPTIFNYLGPFCNPAGVRRQLIGVPNKEIAKKLISVAKKIGYDHLGIVSNDDGLDEIGLSSPTTIYELHNGIIKRKKITPAMYGFETAPVSELHGGTAKENAQIILEILKVKKGPRRDIVLLNAGFAIYIAGAAATVSEGIKKATRSIDSGGAKKVLEKLIIETNKYAKHS